MYPNMMEHPQTIDFTCIKCPKIFTVTHVKKHSCTPQTVIKKCIDCNYLNWITIPPSIKYCSNISCQECYPCKPMLLHSCLGYRPGYSQREEYEIFHGKRNDLFEGPIEICIAESDKLKSRPKFSIFNPPLQTPSSEGSTTIRIHEPPSERFDLKEVLGKDGLKPSSTAPTNITRDRKRLRRPLKFFSTINKTN